jgi:hypothetical protein
MAEEEAPIRSFSANPTSAVEMISSGDIPATLFAVEETSGLSALFPMTEDEALGSLTVNSMAEEEAAIGSFSAVLTAVQLWCLENPDLIDEFNNFVSDWFEDQLSFVAKTFVEEGTLSLDQYLVLVQFIADRDERLVTAFRSFALFKKQIPFLNIILALAKFGEIPNGNIAEALRPFFTNRNPDIDIVVSEVQPSKRKSRRKKRKAQIFSIPPASIHSDTNFFQRIDSIDTTIAEPALLDDSVTEVSSLLYVTITAEELPDVDAEPSIALVDIADQPTIALADIIDPLFTTLVDALVESASLSTVLLDTAGPPLTELAEIISLPSTTLPDIAETSYAALFDIAGHLPAELAEEVRTPSTTPFDIVRPPPTVVVDTARPPPTVVVDTARPPPTVLIDTTRLPPTVLVNIARPPSTALVDIARPLPTVLVTRLPWTNIFLAPSISVCLEKLLIQGVNFMKNLGVNFPNPGVRLMQNPGVNSLCLEVIALVTSSQIPFLPLESVEFISRKPPYLPELYVMIPHLW